MDHVDEYTNMVQKLMRTSGDRPPWVKDSIVYITVSVVVTFIATAIYVRIDDHATWRSSLIGFGLLFFTFFGIMAAPAVVKRVLCVIVGIVCSIAAILGIYDAMHPGSDFMGAAVVGFVAVMVILIVTGLACDSIRDA